jgi:hypothetical protein
MGEVGCATEESLKGYCHNNSGKYINNFSRGFSYSPIKENSAIELL